MTASPLSRPVGTRTLRISLIVNPIAGGGHGALAAETLVESLTEAGHHCLPFETRRGGDRRWLDDALIGSDLAVVVGGDGAVRMVAEPASRAGIPIWQSPLGTENLFAREFSMERGPQSLFAAMAQWRIVTVDLGRAVGSVDRVADNLDGTARDSARTADEFEPVLDGRDTEDEVERADTSNAGGEPFMLMASVGYDAEVVHDLASHRTGGISHLSYVAPMLRRLRGHVPPRLRVLADGERLDDGGRGFVVVANAKQYAMRMNPAKDAAIDDGLLDVVFFPTTNLSDLFGWMLRCEFGHQFEDGRARSARARRVTITSDEPFLYQLDGDPPWTTGVGALVPSLDLAIEPGAVKVLRGG